MTNVPLPGVLRRTAGRVRRHPLRTTLLALLATVLLVPAAAAGVLLADAAGTPPASARTRGRDAVWLGHAWVDGRHGAGATAALARRLRATGIRDVYVHLGPLEHDGTLRASRAPRAAAFARELHRAAPRLRVDAWLGDRLDTEGDPGLDPGSAAARRAVAASAKAVLRRGYDGVHLDLEPAHSGDPGLLRLLDTVHAVTAAAGAPLSVAAPQLDPVPGLHAAAGALTGHPKWWAPDYFARVARRVEQVAVMAYDTALPTRALFTGYLARQTELAAERTPSGTDLLIGLPAYHTDDWGHHASAETVAAAVRGARLGLGRAAPHRARFGLALYVDFAATPADWRAYRDGWVRPPSGRHAASARRPG